MWLTLPTKTMITPRKARDDLRLHARDIFGSYKSNVRREQQGRDTKETDHFDSQAEKEWRLLFAFYTWQGNKLVELDIPMGSPVI